MRFNILLKASFLIVCVLLSTAAIGQKEKEEAKTEDVIYLKGGGVLRGEILIFQESDGDITFKDREGRKYSLTREEYDYFIENEPYKKRAKDLRVVNPRKENELEYTFGLSLPFGTIDGQYDDSYNVQYGDYWAVHPSVNLRAGIGKYLNRRNFVGFRLDYALLGDGIQTLISPAIRYKYQFDGYKRNTAWYILLELQHNYMKGEFRAIRPDEYYTNIYEVDLVSQKHQNFGVSFGQGIAFILANKSSVGFEFSVFKNNVFSFDLVKEKDGYVLYDSLSHTGISFALVYNL